MRIKHISTVKIILLLIISLSFMDSNGQNLRDHQWKNRILIVKTLDVNSKKYQQQLKEFTASSENMIDRKFVLYKVTTPHYSMIHFENTALNTSGKITDESLQKILNKKASFEVILIGLDGGIKLQQTELLTKESLFKIVDTMPMRRNRTEN